MRAYSMDLRQRVLAAVDRGAPRQEIVRTLGVSQPTVRRWLRLRRETGSAAPRPLPDRPSRVGGTPEERRALWAQLEANPEATLERHRELWEQEHGVRVSVATMSPERSAGSAGPTKKERGGRRARRRGAKRLARAGSEARPAEAGLRGRVRHKHRADAAAR